MAYSKATIKALKRLQQDEINAYHIYLKLSKIIKDEKNAAVLARIAGEEKKHYAVFSGFLKHKIRSNRGYIARFILLARVLGLTFALKLMEKKEASVETYEQAMIEIPEIRRIIEDEEAHEDELLGMLNEERLSYMGSVVLGLNDALVELTGALAGFT
ncbi:MAG: rubrerythrin family protein, partial [Eubacteriales bacterium]